MSENLLNKVIIQLEKEKKHLWQIDYLRKAVIQSNYNIYTLRDHVYHLYYFELPSKEIIKIIGRIGL